MSINDIQKLTERITMQLAGLTFHLRIERDCKDKQTGRIFIQVYYMSPCTNTFEIKEWKGRKWYLSDHMTEDEIIKTSYVAFEAAVKHEVLEGFKVDGKKLFNPHVDYSQLLAISHLEVSREKEVQHEKG